MNYKEVFLHQLPKLGIQDSAIREFSAYMSYLWGNREYEFYPQALKVAYAALDFLDQTEDKAHVRRFIAGVMEYTLYGLEHALGDFQTVPSKEMTMNFLTRLKDYISREHPVPPPYGRSREPNWHVAQL